jgi:PAS domain S-box-containing protein
MGNPGWRDDGSERDTGLREVLADVIQQLRQALKVRPLGRMEGPAGRDLTGQLVSTANDLLEALERAEGRAQSTAQEGVELDQALREMEGRLAAEVQAHERTSRELVRQRTILRQTIESLPYCLFWRDRNGVYLGANANKLRALGLASLDQLVGKTTHEICLTKEEADFFLAVDRQVMESGQAIINLEEIQQRPDGPHVLLVSKVPLRDDTGAVVGVLGMYVDVTERQQLSAIGKRPTATTPPVRLRS